MSLQKHPKAIKVEDVFDNTFSPILRDAEGNIEVLLAIQESFLFLWTLKNLTTNEADSIFERLNLRCFPWIC